MQQLKGDKLERVLSIYSKLMRGCVISKSEEAERYGVNERSIQRDVDDIRTYLENRTNEDGCFDSVVYDRNAHGYRLQQIQRILLTNSEILAVCKILLDSRAFTKAEMQSILDRMVLCCTPEADKSTVAKLIGNELFHYVEPRHRTEFIGTMWQIGQAIQESRYMDQYRVEDMN